MCGCCCGKTRITLLGNVLVTMARSRFVPNYRDHVFQVIETHNNIPLFCMDSADNTFKLWFYDSIFFRDRKEKCVYAVCAYNVRTGFCILAYAISCLYLAPLAFLNVTCTLPPSILLYPFVSSQNLDLNFPGASSLPTITVLLS